MKLVTKEIRRKLLANGEKGRRHARDEDHDPVPVVKFFNPCGVGTWLITEMDPEDEDRLFGLCDLGMGFPELGYVSLGELQSVRLPFGLAIERDLYFNPDKTLGDYAKEAKRLGHVAA